MIKPIAHTSNKDANDNNNIFPVQYNTIVLQTTNTGSLGPHTECGFIYNG
jgi:hypothetical protein